MRYRFSIQAECQLLVIVFEGEISASEEAQAIHEIAADPRLTPDAKLLVDRRESRMTVGPEHVEPHLELVRSSFETKGRPRMALLLGHDYDYGMSRMLELTGQDELPHDLGVFRSLEEACAWLVIDADQIVWP